MKKIISIFLLICMLFFNNNIAFSEGMSTYENLKNIGDEFITRLVEVGASEADVERFLDDMDGVVASYQENIYMSDIDLFFITVLLQCLQLEDNISVLVAFDAAYQREIQYMSIHKKVPENMSNFKITVFSDKLIVDIPAVEEDEEGVIDEPIYEDSPVVEPIIPEIQLPFDDIKEVSWCIESVVYLYEHGIVSGTGERIFEPNKLITREEFLRMIVSATLEINDMYYNEYGIAAQGTWFHPYYATAEFYSLFQGIYEEEIFKPGITITRQDMTTIAYRATKRAKIDLPDIKYSTDFMDLKDINYYAVEPIKELQEASIIAGTGNNLFSPDNPTTRAEAARIIYNIMKIKSID